MWTRDQFHQDPKPRLIDLWTTGKGDYRYLSESGEPHPMTDRHADAQRLLAQGHSIRLHEYAIGQAGDHDTWRI
jgi:hypothetical protein